MARREEGLRERLLPAGSVKSYLPSPLVGEGQGEGLSVSVGFFLNPFDMLVSSFTPTLFPPPSRGRVSLMLRCFWEWFFISVLTLPSRHGGGRNE